MERRVLVLSYYFPPAGGPGVQRALKFVKYMPSFGWTPVVLTVRHGAYPARDPSLSADIPEEATVHRTPSLDPHVLYARLTGRSDDDVDVGSVEGREATWTERFARWVRANIFLPDARIGWMPFAVWRGYRLLKEGEIDAILTSGPPHSTHLAGAVLQRGTEVPWVADFRDPWTDINYYQELPHTSWAGRIDAGLERLVLQRADAITTVSPTWRDLLDRKAGPPGSHKAKVVQNGFDEDDVASNQSPSQEAFAVTHVGSLYSSRNPVGLWRAVQQLRNVDSVPDLQVRLVGTVDPNVQESLRAHDLMDVTEIVSYVPHEEAVAEMRRAGVLLLSIEDFPQAEGMITGKIYEYLAAGRPVIGVGPPEGDAAALLQKTGGGQLFSRHDVHGLTSFLRDHYAAWEEGEPQSGASPDAIAPYRRSAQTKSLTTILDSVAGAST